MTSIGFKVVAIFWLFEIARSIPAFFNIFTKAELFGSTETPSYLLSGFFVFLSISISLACVWLLWKAANSIIKPRIEEEVQSLSDNANEFMQVILMCMGVYFIIRSALDFPHQYVLVNIQDPKDPKIVLYKIQLVTIIIKFIFGCLLIAKPKQWVKAIRSIGKK